MLGQITPAGCFPIAGFFLAMSSGGVLAVAGLAAAGIWTPVEWWRALASIGAVLLVCLMVRLGSFWLRSNVC